MAVKVAEPKIQTERVCEERTVFVSSRPISFEEFLKRYGEDDEVELIDGVVVERISAQLSHERQYAWFFSILHQYTETHQLGIVLGSRSAVRITEFRGRLPDILFVRKERLSIVQEKAIYGAPDLIIEIISPGDRRSDLIALETDYRMIGVAEIWLIDQKGRRVRVLRKRERGYEEEILREGILRSEVVEGFWLKVEWLFTEPRPQVAEVLNLLRQQGAEV